MITKFNAASNKPTTSKAKLKGKNLLQEQALAVDAVTLNAKHTNLDDLHKTASEILEAESKQQSELNANTNLAQETETPSEPILLAANTVGATATDAKSAGPSAHVLSAEIPSGMEIGMNYVGAAGGIGLWGYLGGAVGLGGVGAFALKKKTSTAPATDPNAATGTTPGTTNNVPAGTPVQMSGAVADGKIKNAKIYIDLNNDGKADANEYTGLITSNTGNYSGTTTLTLTGHAILAVGGVNIDTNLANNGILKAPEGSTIINPLTTMLQNTMASNPKLTKAEAETKVLTGLGITLAKDQSLTTYDPLAVLASNPNDATALTAQKAAAQIVAIAASVAENNPAALAAAQNGDYTQLYAAYDTAFTAIASTVSAQTTKMDLSSSANITTILTAAKADTALAAAITTSNQAISVATTLTAISTAQKASAPASQLVKALAGGDALLVGTEISNASIINVTPPIGDVVNFVEVHGISKTTGAATIAYANTNGSGNWTFDATNLKDGTLTVKVFTTGIYTGDPRTTTLEMITAPALVGTDAYINLTEATSATKLKLQYAAADPGAVVTVSGTDKAGAAKTVTATLGTGADAGTASFDATAFNDGNLTVNIKPSGAATAITSTVALDTAAPSTPTAVNILSTGGTIINNSWLSTTQTLEIFGTTGGTVSKINVSGTNKNTNAAMTVAATSNSNGTWVFDATQFADGTLSADLTTSDTAGNSINSTHTLTKNTAPSVSITVGSDAYLTSNESNTSTILSATLSNTSDTISSISITDKNGLSISASSYMTAASWLFNPTTLADGPLSVVVTTNTGKVLPAATLTKDTVAPGGATVLAGTDTNINVNEITSTTALKVAPTTAGDIISNVTVSGTLKTGKTTPTVTLTTDTSAGAIAGSKIATFDANAYQDGTLTVTVATTDAAGNTASNSTALQLSSSPVLAGGDAYINKTEATATTSLTMMTAATDPGAVVTISGTDTANVAKTVTATLGTGANAGTATFDATAFKDGVLTVSVTPTGATTATTGTITLDTTAPTAPSTVYGGTNSDAIINLSEATTTTRLDTNATLSSVSVTGKDKANPANSLTLTATKDTANSYMGAGNNYWNFDATKFADGTLTINTVTTDAAGNTTNGSNTISLTTAPSASVLAGSDAYLTSNENYTQSWLSITLSNTSDTVGSVTITDKNGLSAAATSSYGSWSFNSTTLADGALSVVVTTSTGTVLPTATLTKDTVAPGGVTVLSGTDTNITLNEISTTTALKVAPVTAGDIINSVTVSGTLKTGKTTPVVTLTADTSTGAVAGSKIATFDATAYQDGTLTVSVETKDAAGNTTTATASPSSNQKTLQLSSSPLLAGGDAYINKTEATATSALTLMTAATDPSATVTISGAYKTGPNANTAHTVTVTPVNGIATFDATNFKDATALQVTVTPSTGAAVTGTLNLDTVGPVAPSSLGLSWSGSGNTSINHSQVSAATSFYLSSLTDGSVKSVSVSNAGNTISDTAKFVSTDQWSFDATKFANGPLTVTATTADAAGNETVSTYALNLNNSIVTSASNTEYITSTGTTNLTVYQPGADVVAAIKIYQVDPATTGATPVQTITKTAGNWQLNSSLLAQGDFWAVVQTDNGSGVYVNQPAVKMVKDTILPSAPTVTTASGDATITANEISTATEFTITPAAATDTFTLVKVFGWANINDVTNRTYINHQALSKNTAGKWVFDTTPFVNGDTFYVDTTYQDLAGNSSSVSTVIQVSTTPAKVGTDYAINKTEAPAAVLTLLTVPGDTATSVSISGLDFTTGLAKTITSATGGGITLDATAGTATFDARVFKDASTSTPLTLTVNSTQFPNGKTGPLTLDTVDPTASTTVGVGANSTTNTTILAADASTATPLYIPFSTANESIQSVTISGTPKTGNPSSVTATATSATAGVNYTFDATNFADGTLTVTTVTQDTAGNTTSTAKTLTLNTAPSLSVLAGTDAILNKAELSNSAALYTGGVTAVGVLTVSAVNYPAISKVTVSGKSASDTSLTTSVDATYNSGRTPPAYEYDTRLFADGALSIVVTTGTGASAVAQPAITITQDLTLPSVASAKVGADAIITLNEVGAATPLTLALNPAATGVTQTAETITAVTVSGSGGSPSVAATKDVNGNWTFDSRSFTAGTLTVYPTVVDAAGNNSLVPPSPTLNLTLNTDAASVGGDLYINRAESTSATAISLQAPVGDTITGVTVSAGTASLKSGTAPTAVWAGSGATSATFNTAAYNDGTLNVTVSYQNSTSKTTTLTLDTTGPGVTSNKYFTSNSTTLIAKASTTSATNIYLGTDYNPSNPSQMYTPPTAVTITGVKTDLTTGTVSATAISTGSNTWSFDATQFSPGRFAVNATYTDAAGNQTNSSSAFTMSTNGAEPHVNHIANYTTPINLTASASTTISAANLVVMFPYASASGISLVGTTAGAPFTATYSLSTGVTITANASGSGYGSVSLVATDSAGNYVSYDLSVAVTSATLTAPADFVAIGGTTATINAANTTFNATPTTSTQTFDISGVNTNSVMLGGSGADLFILNNPTQNFAQILGGEFFPILDTVRLTSNYQNLDLSQFNHAGQRVLQQIEVIDMATDAGANKVTLTAGDLFLEHSNLNITETLIPSNAMVLRIDGGSNDSVNMLAGGFTKYNASTPYDASGNYLPGGSYSKYIAYYADTSGNHLVEVLIQNNVAVI